MKLDKRSKILCCCSGGKVRSVGAKFILEDQYGCGNVIACGLDKNEPETLYMLATWADVILVVGERQLYLAAMSKLYSHLNRKIWHLDVGTDGYGHYGHKELQRKLKPMIDELMKGDA